MRTAQEQALLVLACGRGLLPAGEAARLEQAAPGPEGHLAQRLVQERLLTPQALSGLLRELARGVWRCPACPEARYAWADLSRLPRLCCPGCRGVLVDHGPLASGSAVGSRTHHAPGSREGPLPEAQGDTRAATRPATHSTHRGRAPVSALPRRLGPYTLEALLGKGSCAKVYLARRDDVARQFALKVVEDPDPDDHELLARFRREVEVASRIRHPGVIPVLHAGEEGGTHYYAMDYAPGVTLKERLRAGGPLPPREAAALVAHIAHAVAAAHAEGVIHRDLKPANIILEAPSGQPRITDFGMARDERARRSMTATGDVLGTPFYMAPEQFRGERDLDHRVDVYALGVILYELLSGQRPYEAPTALALKRRIEQGDPTPLRELCPQVPPRLAEVCARAMAVDKAERHESAEALASELEAEARPEPAPPARRPLLVGLLAGLVVGVLGAGGAAVALLGRAPAPAPPAPAPIVAPAEEVAGHLTRAAASADEQAKLLAPQPWATVEEALTAAQEAAGRDVALRDRVALWRAGYALRRGRWAEALMAAQGLGTPASLVVCAQAQEKLGRRGDARDTWRALVRNEPEGALGLVAQAALARLGGARTQAQSLARQAADRAATAPAAWKELVQASLGVADLDGAQRALDALARLVADDPQEALLRARLYLLRKDVEAARSQLERARALGTAEDPDLLAAEAEAALLVRDLKAAEAAIERALALNPRHLPTLAHRMILTLMRDPTSAGVAALRPLWQSAREVDLAAAEATVSELWPQLLPVLKELQPTEWDKGGKAAQAWIEQLVQRAAPPARGPLQEALTAAVRGARWDEIARATSAAISVAPADPALRREVARVLLGRGLGQEALLHLEHVPVDAERERLLGEALWVSGRPGAGAEALERAAELDPDGREGLSALAELRWLERREGEALEALDRALRGDPDHYPSLLFRGVVLAGKGRDEEAMAQVRAAHERRGFLDVRMLVVVRLAGMADDEAKGLAGDQTSLAYQLVGLTQANELQRAWNRNQYAHLLFLARDLYFRRQQKITLRPTEPGWRGDAYFHLTLGRLLMAAPHSTPEEVRAAWRQALALDPRLRLAAADLQDLGQRFPQVSDPGRFLGEERNRE